MKELIYKVEVKYSTFMFDDADEAMAFAMCAKLHEEEGTRVEIELLEKKDEEQE